MVAHQESAFYIKMLHVEEFFSIKILCGCNLR